MHNRKSLHSAFYENDAAEIFNRGWCKQHISERVLIETDCRQFKVCKGFSFLHKCITINRRTTSWGDLWCSGWLKFASLVIFRWRSLLCFLANHRILVCILQIFVEAFYLKCNLLLDKEEIRHFSVIKVAEEAILLRNAPQICLINDTFDKTSHFFIKYEGPNKIVPKSFSWAPRMIGII